MTQQLPRFLKNELVGLGFGSQQLPPQLLMTIKNCESWNVSDWRVSDGPCQFIFLSKKLNKFKAWGPFLCPFVFSSCGVSNTFMCGDY